MLAFMPTTGQPEEFGHFLKCRAEPNSPPPMPGGISQLNKVNVFTLDAGVSRTLEIFFMNGAIGAGREGRWP